MRLAWHFTTHPDFLRAMQTGVLVPESPPHQRPVLWFSTEKDWAPTSFSRSRRGLEFLTLDAAMTAGLYRIGVAASRLLAGRELRRQARISPSEWEKICCAADEVGVDATRWLGHVGTLSLAEVVIDRFEPSQGWSRVTRMRKVQAAGYVVLDEKALPDAGGSK